VSFFDPADARSGRSTPSRPTTHSLRADPAGQTPAATVGQRVKLQLDRIAEPNRIIAVVFHSVSGQRVDQDVEAVSVQHQIWHDVFELVGLENDQSVADRVRSTRRIAELFNLDV